MTNEQAIAHFKEQLEVFGGEHHEAMKVAIEALEKQIPKKPKWHFDSLIEGGRLPVCPNCNTIMVRTEIFGKCIDEHCVMCGQAIKWGE